VNAVHDISDGGLFIALCEMGMHSGLGFDITSDAEVRMDSFLFGEAQSRVLVTVSPEQEEAFIEFMSQGTVPFTLLGHVTRGKMMVDDEHYGFLEDARDIYMNAISRRLEKRH
jgi:phosphoribosylformylglycinamidine (FGAM) synthase-like enzyme